MLIKPSPATTRVEVHLLACCLTTAHVRRRVRMVEFACVQSPKYISLYVYGVNMCIFLHTVGKTKDMPFRSHDTIAR